MLERAICWVKGQRESADSMTIAWANFVPGWRSELLAYKHDRSKPNPFEEPDPGELPNTCKMYLQTKYLIGDILDTLTKQLAREDSEKQTAGVAYLHGVSPAAFLQQLLVIEAAQ